MGHCISTYRHTYYMLYSIKIFFRRALKCIWKITNKHYPLSKMKTAMTKKSILINRGTSEFPENKHYVISLWWFCFQNIAIANQCNIFQESISLRDSDRSKATRNFNVNSTLFRGKWHKQIIVQSVEVDATRSQQPQRVESIYSNCSRHVSLSRHFE